jgi:hypothetical protein
MQDELPDWLPAFNSHLNDLYENVATLSNSDIDTKYACLVLAEMHEIKKNMSLIYDSMVKIVSDLLDGNEIISVSDVVIEKKYSKSRSGWQHKELATVVSNRIRQMSIDLETGEVLLSTEEMIEKLLEYVQPSYWRTTQLSQIGIDVDDYCNSSESKESIIVRKAK